MALIKCPECKGDVSDKAEACPHCGVRVKKSSGCVGAGCVVALVLFGLVLTLFLLFSSPTNSTSSQGSGNSQPPPPDSATLSKLADIVAQLESTGAVTRIRVVENDQVWVDVTDRFMKQTFEDKRSFAAAIYAVHHAKQPSVNFIVLYDAQTAKSVGMYKPSYGLKLD